MRNVLLRARHIVWLWAAAAAVTALMLLVGETDTSLPGGLIRTEVWIAALSGLLVSGLFSPLLTAYWLRWYWGALVGLPVGACVLSGFFFMQPHSWQASRLDAWKSAALFIDVYPQFILPACILTGAIGTFLIREDRPGTG